MITPLMWFDQVTLTTITPLMWFDQVTLTHDYTIDVV